MEQSKLDLLQGPSIGGISFSPADFLTISASLILFVAATPICRWLNDDDNLSARISMMRALNFLIVLAALAHVLFLPEHDFVAGITQSLIVIYFAVLLTQIINYFVRRRFGKIRTSNDKITISDIYSSRGLSLIVAVMMGIIAIISCLPIIGLNSLLEAGGALGIMGLVLAMTQAEGSREAQHEPEIRVHKTGDYLGGLLLY